MKDQVGTCQKTITLDPIDAPFEDVLFQVIFVDSDTKIGSSTVKAKELANGVEGSGLMTASCQGMMIMKDDPREDRAI